MGKSVPQVSFLMSNREVDKCPKPDRPEYAFIGRSNVGKSSLINMLMQRKNLAKTSSTPGKTQLINHFNVDEAWYLVDLPGYGFAKVPKNERKRFEKMIADYMLERKNLVNVFVLVDARHAPQQIDLEFMEWLGVSQIPFSIVFTKMDKLKRSEMHAKLKAYEKRLLQTWEELPPRFQTSAETSGGREELLDYVGQLNDSFAQRFTL